MGTGKLEKQKLQRIVNEVATLPGDYAEIGVYAGNNFRNLIVLAVEHGKKAWAFDSFRGMDKGTENDTPYYPKGKFDIGGVHNFIRKMPGTHGQEYYAKEGYIPHCFEGIDETFSFIYLDVDTYTPTEKALPWAWEHLATNGYLLFDDYFREGNWGGASEPIDNFLKTVDYEELEYENNQLLVRKL